MELDAVGLDEDEEDTDADDELDEPEGELEELEEVVSVLATGVATGASSARPRSLLEFFELETTGFEEGGAL